MDTEGGIMGFVITPTDSTFLCLMAEYPTMRDKTRAELLRLMSGNGTRVANALVREQKKPSHRHDRFSEAARHMIAWDKANKQAL
jgi:hypothetical protein